VADGVPLTVNAAMETETLRPGTISLVSQSGIFLFTGFCPVDDEDARHRRAATA